MIVRSYKKSSVRILHLHQLKKEEHFLVLLLGEHYLGEMVGERLRFHEDRNLRVMQLSAVWAGYHCGVARMPSQVGRPPHPTVSLKWLYQVRSS